MIKINWPIAAIVTCFISLTGYIVINDINYRRTSLYRDVQMNTYIVYSDWHLFVGTLKGLTLTTYGFVDTLNEAEQLKKHIETKIKVLEKDSSDLDPQIGEPLEAFLSSIEAGLRLGQQLIDNGYLFLDQPDLPLVFKEGRAGLSGLAGKDATEHMGTLSAYQYYQLIGRLRGMNSLFDQIYSDRLNELLANIASRSARLQYNFFILRIILLLFTSIIIILTIFRLYILNRSLKSLADKTSKELVSTRTHLSEVQNYLHNAQFQQSLFQMVAGLSHELNTPLGNCVSLSSYLQSVFSGFKSCTEDGNITKDQFLHDVNKGIEGFELMRDNLEQMKTQIETFKRLASVNHQSSGGKVLLTDYLDHYLQAEVNRKLPGIAAVINSEGCNGLSVRVADLDQIFEQLLNNTAEHTSADKVNISFIKYDDFLKIDYYDNGSGVSSDNISRLSEPFFTTARGKKHMGLGLSIVSSLVNNKLQGNIDFSATGHGLEITIIIQVSVIS
ncbi:MAG: HAMP domain-containing histidine kinase [Spirochaetes bacterium]|nr:HAMP domain-containing histidine kinase [Spirochaetota bacterium]MBN2769689.1 HAMP domain-containing histidine kinase [Spirochaetota bacterium]